MKKFLLFLFSCVVLSAFTFQGKAQLTCDTAMGVPQMVQNYLLGPGVSVTNITYTGKKGSIGVFTTGTLPTNLGISSGLLLTNGQTKGNQAIGSPASNLCDHQNSGSTDPQLQALIPGVTILDASKLEFDFIPLMDTIKFRYVFASEEYPIMVGSQYNDVFGFFVTGPNPLGGNYTNSNIALIPGTATPIAINNVNNGPGNSGPCTNCAYYINNSSGTSIVYNGFTTVLTAWCRVVPCQSYHLKLAVGDASDMSWDSGVFLEANSFVTNNITVTANGAPSVSVCSGTPTTLDASGAVSYLWLPDSLYGPTVTVSPLVTTTYTVVGTSTMGCTGSSVFTVTVRPTPTVAAEANQIYCNGISVPVNTLSGPVSGTTFAWTNNNTSIGLAASGSGNIPAFTATNTGTTSVTATITITPTAASCVGPPLTYTITVHPTPTVIVPNNLTYCNNFFIPATNFTSTPAGATYSWTNSNTAIGLGASGSGNIAPFTATNTGYSPISATITVTPTANGCAGTPSTYTITVMPLATVFVPGDINLCNGETVPGTNFTSQTPGVTFSWANSNTAIGLSASGSGDITAFTSTNSGSSPISAIITVTPTVNTCPGTASTYTITIYPTPTVTAVPNQTYCNGDVAPITTLSGSVTGTYFGWTNSNPGVGLSTQGSGNPPSFTATNTTSAPITSTVTITPSTDSCMGTPITYTITVNPIPDIEEVPDQTYCNGQNAPVTVFSGSLPGTTFTWTNSNTAVGLGSGGTGDIPSFAATNTDTTSITATITITPSLNGCDGTPTTYTITVNPIQITIGLVSMTEADCLGKDKGSIEIEVSGGDEPYSYMWSNGAETQNITGLDAGVYTVTVNDVYGCENSYSAQIVPGLEIPITNENDKLNNVFSPNGDNKNDKWVIKNIDLYPENELYVFNRWGNEVFSVKGYNNDWDGSNLTEGTYLFILKINMCATDKTYRDYVTIVR